MTDLDRTELDRLRELAAQAGTHAWTLSSNPPSEYGEFIAFANPERVTRLVGLVEELTETLRRIEMDWCSHIPECEPDCVCSLRQARVLLDRLGAT